MFQGARPFNSDFRESAILFEKFVESCGNEIEIIYFDSETVQKKYQSLVEKLQINRHEINIC